MSCYGAAHFCGTRSPNLFRVPASSPRAGTHIFQCSFALKIVHQLVSVRPRPTDSFKGLIPRHSPRAPEVCKLVLLF